MRTFITRLHPAINRRTHTPGSQPPPQLAQGCTPPPAALAMEPEGAEPGTSLDYPKDPRNQHRTEKSSGLSPMEPLIAACRLSPAYLSGNDGRLSLT